MTMMKRTFATLLSASLAGCLSNPIEVTGGESSSSSSDGSAGSATTFESVSTSQTTGLTMTDDDGSSGESGTDGTDGTSDESGSSTGEVVTDWALAFDGDSRVRSFADYLWGSDEITVEAWVGITDTTATGIIVDAQLPTLDGGWAFYFHPESGGLIFSFFDGAGATHFLEGPSASDIGVGWHHVAAVKTFDVGIALFVDGEEQISQGPVPQAIGDASTQVTIGAHVNDSADFALRGATIDDVVISRAARYAGSFEPVSEPVADPDTILLMRFDEGEGVSTSAEDQEVFTIVSPQWVRGHMQ